MDWSEDRWPGRAKGVDSKTIYSFLERFDFRAGSYSGYNEWRDWLAQVGGWQSAKEAWTAENGPFFELVHFADNAGVLGPEVSAKLLMDFVEHDEKAKAADPEGDLGYHYQRYQEWRRAFELSADGGAVDFH